MARHKASSERPPLSQDPHEQWPADPVLVAAARRRSRWWVALPVATMLVGAGGGAAGMWAADRGRSDPAASASSIRPAPAATPAPSPSASGPVSKPCLDVARRAGDVGDILSQAGTAVAHLDLTALQRLVDRAEAVQSQLTKAISACQGSA